jgi:hypothetical protein
VVPSQLIHSDICGPMNVKTRRVESYFIIYCLMTSPVSGTFNLISQNYMSLVEIRLERKNKVLRADKDGEYQSTSFKELNDEKGIVHQTTMSYTPQQNVVAERGNMTQMKIVR